MEKIGAGTFRIVYAYPSDPESLAVKVPRAEVRRHGRTMNSEEIKSHRLFPEIFPRTHNDNLDQLVVDRADIIATPDDLMRAVPELTRLSTMQTQGSIWDLFRALIGVALNRLSPGDVEQEFGIPGRLTKSVVKKSRLLSTIASAVDTLNIDVTDIDRGNIGVSRSTKKFVLVDASTLAGFSG